MPPGARKLPRVVLDVLSDIERQEAHLLCWGVVDGVFTKNELIDLVQRRLLEALEVRPSDVPYSSAEEVVDVLKAHGLIFELPHPTPGRYRSRMAEAVRLLFRLKQLFPKHAKEGRWRTAPDLVADYRLLLRPREYPKRHIQLSTVQERLAAVGAGDALSRKVLATLLSDRAAEPFQLADFQVEAAERILDHLSQSPRRAGTIVCAGTGSGKTLAFYLPAMLLLARLAGPDRWTRCIALYPRNELLKDQLSSALRQVLALNKVLAEEGRPPVSIGALFGEVPSKADSQDTFQRSWQRTDTGKASGYTCPYVSCPRLGCAGADLVWLDSDRNRGIERLCCSCAECGFVVDGTYFMLTRASMTERPPDLLFTGLELVNQSMSSIRDRRLLGIDVDRPDRRPRLVLLDEAHTYSGSYGAQAALLLRRWKRASMANPHFVGLSATLEDARRFFAALVGEPESRVEEVSPRSADLVPEGQEILLALRGDPVSKTSLLSTSIQTGMLLRRILDPSGTNDSLFGTKVFAFTDDLDVTNRLYHNLLDAEGWEVARNGVRPRRGEPLAWLRRREADEHRARFVAGQSWDLVEDLGHEIREQPTVRVGRTSSQDAGVDRAAETIVATASLEVGFDDPDVGGVLQHKAPHDAASFLQRKGRAGRPRGTRPWTVVVLSDFGRDRFAYQGYEQLFSPELRPRYLPIGNRHVLRMQAVYVLMDWLADQLRLRFRDRYVRLWPALAQPPLSDSFQHYNEQRLDHVIEVVEGILSGGAGERQLAAYMEQALSVSADVVEQLLWAPPRSLMLSVLPTIVRRLRCRWKVAVPAGAQSRLEPNTFWAPLPEFVPAKLFSDLNLPEVTVSLPPHGLDDVEQMPVAHALREFAPGRVSRRFGVSHRNVAHWIPVPDHGSSTCDVDDLCGPGGADELGYFCIDAGEGVEEIACLRPRRLRVQQPPDDVGVTSHAQLRWATQILPPVEAVELELPTGSPWLAVVRAVEFFAHGYGNAIEVRRFALGSAYDLSLKGAENSSGTVAFSRGRGDGAERVALGYAIDADAMCIKVRLPTELHRIVRQHPELMRALRTARFAYEVQADSDLDDIANAFEREWLVQICLSALLLEAAQRNEPLEVATKAVFEERSTVPLEEVLDVIFQSTLDSEPGVATEDRREDIQSLLRDAVVQAALRRAAAALWTDPDAAWEPWLRQRFLSTLGAAIVEACQHLCPEVDAGDLCLDIDPGPRTADEVRSRQGREEIWLTETSPGGSGVVEAVSAAYAADPRRFFHLVEASLAPSDFEEIDGELETLVRWLAASSTAFRSSIAEAVQTVRSTQTHYDTVAAHARLRQRLEQAGLALTHPVSVAMQARILRPGSSPESDELLATMVVRWRSLEERLGVEVDSRIVAYLMSAEDGLDRALGGLGSIPLGSDRRAWRYGTLYGLLWPRGSSVRSHALSAYNPFTGLPATERWLVLALLPATTVEVQLEASDWYRRLCVALINHGAVVLTAPPERRRDLRAAIQRTLSEPLDTESLLVPPALVGVSQEGGRLRARFELREALQ